MINKISIIGPAITTGELWSAFVGSFDSSVAKKFRLRLSEFIHSPYIYLANSGISAFYIILEALKINSSKTEVILPAYTAGSLVVAVKKAGLRPVLCDVSLNDFNLDRQFLLKAVTANTLAIVCVHMFGIGMQDIERIKKELPDSVFLIEDCAQSMGSKVESRYTGTFGDISFFSFNRGKNMAAFGGGCIATDSKELAGGLDMVYEKEVKDYNQRDNLSAFFLSLIISFTIQPLIYGFIHSLIARFKDVAPPVDFSVKKICPFQAGLGINMLRKLEVLADERFRKGIFLINALKNRQEFILPNVRQDSRPAFNRLPIVFRDSNKRDAAEKRLWLAGIETSRMYNQPLHHMFSLGYENNDFPLSVYLSQGVLTLPVHPLIDDCALGRIIGVLKNI